MAKPAAPAEWASGAAPADVVEPAGAKQAAGWNASEKPPHGYFNWFWQLLTLWLIWIDSVILDGAVAGRLGAHGVDSTAADANGAGLTAAARAVASDTGAGVMATGGGTAGGAAWGPGVHAIGGGGLAGGAGEGVLAEAYGAPAVHAHADYARAVYAESANGVPLHLHPGSLHNGTDYLPAQMGDMYVTAAGALMFYDGAAWRTVQLV